MRPSDASGNGAAAGGYQIPRWLRPYWKNKLLDPNRSTRVIVPESAAAIAVVGVSAHVPMASDIGQFWDNLVVGKDCITNVPSDRWDWQGIHGDLADSESGILRGGFIDGIDEFDPMFFNISPREAALMDPQQRLLLLHVRHVIEDAGYTARSFAGTETGVFVGALGHDYIRVSSRAHRPTEGYTSTGTITSIGPARVSHHFDLRGPSEPVETACASSLVAIHRAVCAIRNGECSAAIAAGINLLLTPDLNLSFARAGMLSPDGRCKVFSKDANGYVRGEGIGVVLIKKLSDAERDGDHIYAVIRATAVNHGGRSRSMTAPNPEAQAELLYRVYSQAGIDPSTVSYIETHGTGTALGDPIEIEALKAAFDRLYRQRGATPGIAHCGLGSVKSNIGHLEIAAGIAGLMKVILQLKHRTLVSTLHCEPLNPYIALDNSPFYLVRETQPWAARIEDGQPLPRRAGVSSFGFGGVNAHLVLEEYCPAQRAPVRSRSLPPSAFDLRKFPLPRSRAAGSIANPLKCSAGDIGVRRWDIPLNGSERFLEHHVIQGERLLPAVVYLEAVRSAFELSAQTLESEHPRLLRFSEISWSAPLAVSQPVSLSIGLHAAARRQARFEAGARVDDTDAPATVNAAGMIEFEPLDVRPVLDLALVRSRCTQALYSHEHCYAAFADLGFQYGPGHRTIHSLQVGPNEILAQLALPESAADTVDQWVMQPGILDGALQSIIGFHLADTPWRLGPCSRPFKCASVEVFASSAGVKWAVLKACDEDRDDATGQFFDIDLCGDDGTVCIRFRRFTVRDVQQGRMTEPSIDTRGLFLAPIWTSLLPTPDNIASQSVDASVIIGGSTAECDALRRHSPGLCMVQLGSSDDPEELRRTLASVGEISHLVWLVPADVPTSLCDESILISQSHGILFALKLAQALLALGYGSRPLTWTTVTRGAVAVHSCEQANPTHAGLQGFIGSIAKEHPHWGLQVLDVPATSELPATLLRLCGTKQALCAYRNGLWFQRLACVVDQMPSDEEPVVAGSVYVIIGGAGGIGQAISRLLSKQPQVQLVWIGRRSRDRTIQAMIDELSWSGRAPYYIRADVSDRMQLERARNTIERMFGRIDGLIHAAMVLRDQLLARMSVESLREVMVAKVDGCLRLAQVFGTADLRFVLFFSSMNSFSTFAGQANYAAASCFEDAFALELANSWRCRVRVINWGYWGQVGAVASESHRLRMSRIGIGSIQTPEAMQVMRQVLAAPLIQCGYIRVTASADLVALGVESEYRLAMSAPVPSYRAPTHVPIVAWQGKQPHALAREREMFDRGLLQSLWHQLQTWCGFDEPLAIEAICEKAAIQRKFIPWFERSVDELIASGFLQARDGLLSATAKGRVTAGSIQSSEFPGAFEDNEQRGKQWEFAQTMLRALQDILTGRQDCVEVMFSEPTSTLMVESYRDDPVVSYCDRMLAAVAADCVARRIENDAHAQIRLLEIGAGRGATTRWVVEALRPYEDAIAEYAYTDISPAFLGAGRNADLMLPGYVNYRTFDVESDPQVQGLTLGEYDIVIAGNVLHATKSLEKTLRHSKALLRSGGVLLLHELTSNPLFAHLTYGLLDGWWHFGDHGWRMPGGPAARPQAWREMLGLTGFLNVTFPAERMHALSHQVVVAESDGMVLLPRARTLKESAGANGHEASTADVHTELPKEIAMRDIWSQLRSLVAQVLGMEEAELDRQSQPFPLTLLGELGMDSLASINLRKSIRLKFGVDVSTQKILGQRADTIADAIYKQILLRQMVSQTPLPDATRVETFTF